MSEFLVVTGLSGAGRSTAAATLEDLGWFVIDNLPTSLISKVAELVGRPGSETERVALVVGRGGGEHLGEHVEDVPLMLDALEHARHRVRVLFLDAPDEVLVRRFEGTRRRHPLAARGVEASIADERRLLEPLRARADIVLDTGELNVNQLRARLLELFAAEEDGGQMRSSILSFGYKHGIPLDVDLLFDCRFLPNPHWVEGLRDLSGLDPEVRSYVLAQPQTEEFLAKVADLLATLVPAYAREGKSYLTVAMGCTGGRHRSVVLAEALAERLAGLGVRTSVFHRDVDR
ncbi:MAG TPA: RNase adapter RapZ [Acidimicrobiales bacterium]|nr:RNase adapter RapZ [Acidimicrobiales bacterium]HLH46506.1 RNase adapter RapZ [Acidimicrobiales bacterium]